MRRIIALSLVAALLVGFAVPAAEAYHGAPGVVIGTAVGLALAAPFLIVGALLAPLAAPPPVYRYPAVVESPAVVAPAPTAAHVASRAVSLQPPARSYGTVVEYPHGRHVLRGDGVNVAYRWVWIPNPPPPPPADNAPTAPAHERSRTAESGLEGWGRFEVRSAVKPGTAEGGK